MRADAERSTARILEAAEAVLAEDVNASLERVADAAGLARATVHRRFASRKALVEALTVQLNERYLEAIRQARVETAPPLVALHRLTETVFELKISHRFAINAASDPVTALPTLSPAVERGLDRLFERLRAAGVITAAAPEWSRRIYLAVLCEVDRLAAAAPDLAGEKAATPGPAGEEAGAPEVGGDKAGDEVGARTDLTVRTVIGALGGDAQALVTLRT
ncbi:TetR/AcrR family transcriptional regulator [Actinoplanes sp. NPDC049265]|uniref:TetR/AcrR family transcriptional regulator n=1 Tax=Actinoplanes sp. NPDC049265 TaxID=3363902 RepID=UPI0037103549